MASFVRQSRIINLRVFESLLRRHDFHTGHIAAIIKPIRKELTISKNVAEDKLYDNPARDAFREALEIADAPRDLNKYTIKINDPTGKFKLIDDEDEQPWLSRKRVSKRRDIFAALKAFGETLHSRPKVKSERIRKIFDNYSESLAPSFKSRIRAESAQVVVLPEIRGVNYMTVKSLNLKMNFFRRQGLSLDDTCKMLAEWPLILNENLVSVQTKLNFLVEVGYTSRMVRLILCKAGKVFTWPLETLFESKVSDIKEFDVLPNLSRMDAIDIIQRCPSLLLNKSSDRLFEKMRYMKKELRFSKQQLRNMIMRQPSVLKMRMESMKEKLDFCTVVLGASRSSVARCPRVFQCSVSRLEERHAFLYAKDVLNPDEQIGDYGLGVLATAPDALFVKEVAKATTEEYEEFLKNYREEAAKRKAIAEERKKKEKQEKPATEIEDSSENKEE